MYVAGPPFQPPPDPNIRIWRYMDFAKFVSMIDSRSLRFTRLDQMEDEYEGAFSEASFDVVKAVQDGEDYEVMEAVLNQQQRDVMNFVRKINRKGTFVNCWHMNEVESVAMWKIYSESGIAVQSTFQRLADSFTVPHEPVSISTIQYEDFLHFQMRFAADAWVEPVLYKRKSFEYERELRAFWLYPPNRNRKIDLTVEDHPTGSDMDVNLRTLIEHVYISPGRRGWFKHLIRSVLDKYDYVDIPVVPSALDDIPHTRSWKEVESADNGSE